MQESSDEKNSPDNEPKYHHFVPQFYLSRWANTERKLCRFSKPRDVVIPKMVGIKRTGGQEGLYTLGSGPPSEAQSLEKGPLRTIDTGASDSLRMLEDGDERIRETVPRSNWSCFLMSMMMRGPKDIEVIKAAFAKDWEASIPDMVARLEQSEERRHLVTLIPRPSSARVADWGLKMAIEKLIDHGGIGQLMNNMCWFVRDIQGNVPELLTSDRPMYMSDTLVKHDGFLLMPIGPRKLFMAVKTKEIVRRVMMYDPAEQVKNVNRFIIGQAQEWVYGTNDAQLDFVRENMGAKPKKTLFERLVELRDASS